MVPIQLPDIGQIVEVLRGREKGLFGVVVGHLEGRFVLLADGHHRKVEHPKRKNVLHTRKTDQSIATIVPTDPAAEKLTNAHLRYCLRLFVQMKNADENRRVEGSEQSGER